MKNKLISFILALCLLIAIPLSARYKYNPFTRKLDYYEPVSGSDLGDLGDVTLTGLATGNVLYYNGTVWVNLVTGANTQVLTLVAGIPAWATINTLGAVQFTGDVEFQENMDTDWNDAGDTSQIVQASVVGTENSPLVLIQDAREGTTVDELIEATLRINAAGTYAFYIQAGQAYFADDTTQIEDVFVSWADAADHMVITQNSEEGTEDVPLIDIVDDREGETATETSEATLRITAADGYALSVTNPGKAYFGGDTTQIEDVFITWAQAADHMRIIQGSAAGIEAQALIYINDDRIGTTANEPDEATLMMAAEAGDSWAIYVQTAKVQFDADFILSWRSDSDNAVITQTATAGIEDVPLIFINDDRTGATATELSEATIIIDSEGVYSTYFLDGNVYLAAAAVLESAGDIATTGKLWAKDNAWITWGTATDWQSNWDSNSTGDDLLVYIYQGSDTSAIWYSILNPSAMTDHDNYLSPTFILTNDEGADTYDYAGVVIGERAQNNVKAAHYFDFYAMTGSADGSVDTADEVAAIFRFGASGSAVPGSATTPGDVLFEGNIEVDGVIYPDAGVDVVTAVAQAFKAEYNVGAQLGAWVHGVKVEQTRTADIQPSTGTWFGGQFVLNAGSSGYTALDKPAYALQAVFKGSDTSPDGVDIHVGRFETQSAGKVSDIIHILANTGTTIVGSLEYIATHVAPGLAMLTINAQSSVTVPTGIHIMDGVGSSYNYGIDLSSATINTADIVLGYGETIKNTTDGRIDLGGNVYMVGTGQFVAGTSINEFSIDGTLAGDSDDAVPTEKAVKTYIDIAAGEPSIMEKRWMKVVMNHGTYDEFGLVFVSNGVKTNDDDDNSNFTRWATGSSPGNGAGLYTASNNFVRSHHNPTFWCKFKTHSDITNMRFFIGLSADTTDWNADPSNGNLIMLRYVSGTANFTYITKDGTTLNSQDSGVVVAASTVYVLKIVVSGDGTKATFTIDGANSVDSTANLPSASAPLGFSIWLVTQESASKYLSLSQIYCEGE